MLFNQRALIQQHSINGETPMKYMSTTATAAHFGVPTHTLKTWRLGSQYNPPLLTEGVHWVRRGKRAILYNVALLEDWILNNESNPEAHKRAIDSFLESLPSNAGWNGT